MVIIVSEWHQNDSTEMILRGITKNYIAQLIIRKIIRAYTAPAAQMEFLCFNMWIPWVCCSVIFSFVMRLLIKYYSFKFSPASTLSGIRNPYIWLANHMHFSSPFRTDHYKNFQLWQLFKFFVTLKNNEKSKHSTVR